MIEKLNEEVEILINEKIEVLMIQLTSHFC